MTRKSKRDLERNLETVEEIIGSEIPEDWKRTTPRELWHSPLEAWKYSASGGSSHPDLEPPEQP